MSFLVRTNFDHVFGLARQYFQDTNTLFVTDKELHKLVADTMVQIQAAKERDKEEVDIERWNKQTILAVREIMRQQKPATTVENQQPSEPAGDPFFTKLQELEVARKAGNVWMQTDTPVSAPPPPPPAAVPSPPVTSVSTIYMQAPPEKGTAIHIRSWHRPWMTSPSRAAFLWQGPFPASMDVNTMYVSSVIVPKQTMIWTPYVILEMEGAGGQINECILTPDSKSVSNVWEYLRPCTRAVGYVRPLALPWKLRLLDADRELLPFGKDHWKIDGIQHVGNNNISRLAVSCVSGSGETIALNKDFVTNEWLLLTCNDTEVKCKVVAVGPSTIDVDEVVTLKYIGASILHLHRQSCIILETTQTTHTKK